MGYDPNQAQQMVQTIAGDPLTWAQIFYYVAGGTAALLVAIKGVFMVKNRRK